MLVRDGLSSYPGCQGNPIWSKLSEQNWDTDLSAHGFGSPTGSDGDGSTSEIATVSVREGDTLDLQCHAWKKCYGGYGEKKYYFYHIESVKVCRPYNCFDFPEGSKIMDYSRQKFGVRIMKMRPDYSGMWACRIEDSDTGNWLTLRNFNVTVIDADMANNDEVENS